MEAEGNADEGIEAGGNADEGNEDEMYLFSDEIRKISIILST